MTGGGRGVMTTVAAVAVAVVGIAIFIAVVMVVAVVFLLAIVAALGVVAVRTLMHAISPRRGHHPVDRTGFGPASVIEGTATVIRRAAPKPRH
jgi:hypothetical protein